jgi:hypothetical protein
MNLSAPASTRSGLLRTVLGMMINPGGLLKSRLAETGFGAALGISGLAFLLFFLQTGIDRARVGQIGIGAVAAMGFIGLVYGTAGVAIIGFVGWAGARLLGGKGSIGEAIRAFGLAYSPTLVYAAMGLFFNLLFGWNTAVAFGVTGLLWALGPMIAALKEMVGGRNGAAAGLATVCGLLLLLGWVRLGGIA